MHFSVVKEDILKYLQYANSFTNPKGLNDILQNIYMEAENNMVNIKATNYQMGFSCNFEVHNVEQEGRITVSCRKLLDIIKELPDGALIDFQYDDTRLNVICGKSKFKLSTIPSENFPSIGEIIPEYFLKINSADLITLLKRTVFCILNDSQKLEYTGAQFTVNRDMLEISATGMQRVAIASVKFDTEYSNDFTVNIPKKTVSEIIRVFENKGLIEIETDRRQISFKADNITVYSKLIEKFVKNIDRLFMADKYPVKAKIDRKSFIEASKRVSAITSEETPGIILEFNNSALKMSSLETIYGEGSEVIDILDFNSESFEIILNARHVNEILNIIETEDFTLEMSDKRSPVLITPSESNYRYLVVPISIDKI